MPRRLVGIYGNCIYWEWAVYKEFFTAGSSQRHSEFCDACIIISVFNEKLPKGRHQSAKGRQGPHQQVGKGTRLAKGDSKHSNQDVDKFPCWTSEMALT